MTDRRILKTNGRVAHSSLQGQVEAKQFVDGDLQRVIVARTELWPGLGTGPMDRELNFGEEFVMLECHSAVPGGAQFAFGFCQRDGAVGWVHTSALVDPVKATHKIAVARSYAKMSSELKQTEDMMPLSFGSLLSVLSVKGPWSQIDTEKDFPAWVPSIHLSRVTAMEIDPVQVARLFLGTPYVWGGNSAFGIDCSGLVQAALLACGRECPSDSDLQMTMPGQNLTEKEPLRAGDLMFWKGHVAMATGPLSMIHANAHHMAVVEEPIEAALARIAATDTGDVTLRLRPNPPRE